MNTTVNHHPDVQRLSEYAAGTSPLAQSLCVAAHLHYCGSCRRQLGQLQQVGAALFGQLAPAAVDGSALGQLMARLDGADSSATADRADPSHANSRADPSRVNDIDASRANDRADPSRANDTHPTLLRRIVAGDYSGLTWRRPNGLLRTAYLPTGDPHNELALYHIKAGGGIPRHGHRGTELTLVLEGGLRDAAGSYRRGDFIERSPGDVHAPAAEPEEDCICLGALDAPIRFKAWRYRIFNPFLRLRAC